MKTSNLISSVFLGAVITFSAISSMAQKIDRPTWLTGDAWEYKLTEKNDGNKVSDFQHVIEKIEDGKLVIRTGRKGADGIFSRGALLTYTADMNYQSSSGNGSTITPDSQFLNWPLEAGKTYSVDATWVNASTSQNGKNDLKVEVSGPEDVTVPAGTFKAYKISAKGFWNRRDSQFSGSGRATETIWYVPEIKRWVKWETQNRTNQGALFTDSVAELTKFTAGK